MNKFIDLPRMHKATIVLQCPKCQKYFYDTKADIKCCGTPMSKFEVIKDRRNSS
jgi:hypothetical protein